MKVIVAVVVYDRFDNVREWIRCFKLSDTRNAELIIIHNIKCEEDITTCRKICSDNNIKYISRGNMGYDIGALQDVCKQRLIGFPNQWDYLLWVTDDVIPMYKMFIPAFVAEVQKPNVGLACLEISDEVKRHVRTSGFIIPKKFSLRLQFPADPITTKKECYEFEHRGNNTLLSQITKMGRTCVQVSPTLMVSHLWDTDLRKKLNRWNDHYREFPKPNEPPVYSRRIKKPEIFFHIARRGNWREIAREQFALLSSVGLNNVNVTLFCSDGSAQECIEIAANNNVNINVLIDDPRIGYPWEIPTLAEIQKWCKANPDSTILYMGTKGVLNPSNHWENYFRMIIAFITIGRWYENVPLLDNYDVVGPNYISRLKYEGSLVPPHFSGSFYIARANWINKLPDIWEYSNSRFGELLYKDSNSPWERMCTEFWIAARPNIRFKSLEIQENYWFSGNGMPEILKGLIKKYPNVHYPEAVKILNN